MNKLTDGEEGWLSDDTPRPSRSLDSPLLTSPHLIPSPHLTSSPPRLFCSHPLLLPSLLLPFRWVLVITAIIVALTAYISGTAAVEVTVVVVVSLLALPIANIIQKGMAQMLLVMGKPTDQDTRAERAVKKMLRVFTLGDFAEEQVVDDGVHERYVRWAPLTTTDDPSNHHTTTTQPPHNHHTTTTPLHTVQPPPPPPGTRLSPTSTTSSVASSPRRYQASVSMARAVVSRKASCSSMYMVRTCSKSCRRW